MSRRCLVIAALSFGCGFAAPKPALPAATNSPATLVKSSAIWPEKLGDLLRNALEPAQPPSDPALWEEFGFDKAERASYSKGPRKLTAVAYRLKDPTGAVAIFQLLRPPDAKPVKLADHAVTTSSGAIVLYGNYVLDFAAGRPTGPELKQLVGMLPKLDQSSLPAILAYLPDPGLVPNSERYVLGPESLQRIEPRVPPSTAAFHLGAEAQTGLYRTAHGDARLLVFSYPTPQLARERESEFRKIPGAVVKRAGPLVAATIAPPNADDAERLLAGVKYQPTVTWNEHVPKTSAETARDLSNMILGIVMLAVVLIATSVLLGFFFGGFRVVLARFGIRSAAQEITTLHLSDK